MGDGKRAGDRAQMWNGPGENFAMDASVAVRCGVVRFVLSLLAVVLSSLCGPVLAQSDAVRFAEIQVVDNASGRGIPLVTLTTVDDQQWVTDNLGRVVVEDGELLGQQVFFKVTSPGYEVAKDGFGIAGVRLQLAAGSSHVVQIERTQVAERLYRVTGRGRFGHSQRAGKSVAAGEQGIRGQVVGQDSVQTAVFGGRMHWFWGDTNRISYPLGLFRTAGAVSELPAPGQWQPEQGVPLQYFTREDGFVRAMVDIPEREGVVWIQGVCTVLDVDGEERMVCQYSRRRGLADPLEQGHLIWNSDRELFEVFEQIDLSEQWRQLGEHPLRVSAADVADAAGTEWLCFGRPFPVVRVPATVAAVRDRRAYESWTCIDPQSDAERPRPLRTAGGVLDYAWRKLPPVTQQLERRWLRDGLIQESELRLLPQAAGTNGERVLFHAGTVYFNSHRGRWILIGNEQATTRDADSYLGEVYYSEAETAQGLFRTAVRIATHPGQSFYNPCQHPEFDGRGGREVYFEGTYTNMFTQSPATPLYNYNQLMYRLDLDAEQIRSVFGEPAVRP